MRGTAKIVAGVGCLAVTIMIVVISRDRRNPIIQPKPFEPVVPALLVTQQASAPQRSGMPAFKGNLRVEDMTPEQRDVLAHMFTNQFKPALRKWCQAYHGHLPIDPSDVRLDQFKNRLGNDNGYGTQMYSFVTDSGATITFAARSGNPAYIMQFMTRDAGPALNSLPTPGTAPNLTTPVNRQDVIQMVEEDTGYIFSPNNVLLRPTGAACSLQGGAFVDLGGNYGDQYYHITGTNVQFVFGSDGNIVNYERDPAP